MSRFRPTAAPPGRLARLSVVLDTRDAPSRLREVARMCDRAGVDALWVADHRAPAAGAPRLDAWTALILGALDTSRARLGAMLEPTSRPPTVLAAMARTLDIAAGGRLELGVESDRVGGTEEYARTLRDLLADGPPLSIAIDGPREIGVAVRLADDVVIPASAIQDVPGLIGAIRAGCEAGGRDPRTLGFAVEVPVSIGRTSAEAHARARHDPLFHDIDDLAARGLFGTLEQCQDRAIELAHLGITDLRCLLPNTPDVHDAIAQLTAVVVGTVDVLTPNSPRSKAPDPPEGWGGRPVRR